MTVVALASAAVICVTAIIEPSSAFIAATALLIPITAAVPYLEVRSLRLLMIVAWVGDASPLPRQACYPMPQSRRAPPAVGRLWGPAVVSGLVLFLLYQSSERLKASSREFSRLFSLSSDLAEATDPGVLGDLVARHLDRGDGDGRLRDLRARSGDRPAVAVRLASGGALDGRPTRMH